MFFFGIIPLFYMQFVADASLISSSLGPKGKRNIKPPIKPKPFSRTYKLDRKLILDNSAETVTGKASAFQQTHSKASRYAYNETGWSFE